MWLCDYGEPRRLLIPFGDPMMRYRASEMAASYHRHIGWRGTQKDGVLEGDSRKWPVDRPFRLVGVVGGAALLHRGAIRRRGPSTHRPGTGCPHLSPLVFIGGGLSRSGAPRKSLAIRVRVPVVCFSSRGGAPVGNVLHAHYCSTLLRHVTDEKRSTRFWSFFFF